MWQNAADFDNLDNISVGSELSVVDDDEGPVMAMNLNRRRRPGRNVVPLGALQQVIDKKMTEEKMNMEVASVVVTINDGESYDDLFSRISQESEYGRVAVYEVHPGRVLEYIQRALNNEIVDNFTEHGSETKLAPQLREQLKNLKRDCEAAGPEAVCVNFECCDGYSATGFCSNGNQQYKDIYMDLISFLVKEFGCMTMFSDFSLKALITDWDVNRLGPNPFRNVGEFGGDLELGFNPEMLKLSPSAQLNTVGSLSEGGMAKLHAMPGTILFTITEEANQIALETEQTKGTQVSVEPLERKYVEPFEVEVLTVATKCSNENFTRNKLGELDGQDGVVQCEIGEKFGFAGHVLITFAPSERSIERFKVEVEEQEVARAQAIAANKEIKDDAEEEITPARGMILASSGHWVELMKIDVNMTRLLETVQKEWGEDARRFQSLRSSFDRMSISEMSEQARVRANSYIQSRAPAKFNKKLKRMKKNGY